MFPSQPGILVDPRGERKPSGVTIRPTFCGKIQRHEINS
jgi:hypothetical protein